MPGYHINRLPNGGAIVTVLRETVQSFRDSWPCNNLSDRPYTFEFSGNQCLIDTDVHEDEDGDAAVALSYDAQEAWIQAGMA